MRLIRIFTTFHTELAGCMNKDNIRKCGWVEVPLPLKMEHMSNEEILDSKQTWPLDYIEGDLQIFLLSTKKTPCIEIVERDVDSVFIPYEGENKGFIN